MEAILASLFHNSSSTVLQLGRQIREQCLRAGIGKT